MSFTGSSWIMALIFFFGWALNGVFPLFMATIPSESVDPRLTASLTGIVMGIGEVVGGVLSPALAGRLSDVYGRDSIMWMMMLLCIAAGFVGLGLRETAPRVLARRRVATLSASAVS
jgi:MFS transporter, ACS family, hexuronate transporter